MDKRKKLSSLYEIIIGVLALGSVSLVILDLCSVIVLNSQPYKAIDTTILIIFTIDYVVRFTLSKKKLTFFKSNIFDLIAIIPLNEIFSLFRMARLFRLTKLVKLVKLTKLVRMVGFIGIFKTRCSKFLKTNGFIYMIYCSLGLILVGSIAMTFIEGGTFWDNLWWSIVTCTTVGYGDISPATPAGRVIAVILMVFGIGFIGMLTGTITTYFTRKLKSDDNNDDVQYDELLTAVKELNGDQLQDLTNIAKVLKNGSFSFSTAEKVTK